jgi:hypothetical protein
MTFFSFDTSAILNGRRDVLPPDLVPGLWANIEVMIELGDIRCVDVVRDELMRFSDEPSSWARKQKRLFVPLELDVQRATKDVLAAHPKMLGVGGRRNGADPFVVALAMCRGGSVVTEETPSNTLKKPKIPEVCEAMGVPCYNLVRFAQWQGWQFGA